MNINKDQLEKSKEIIKKYVPKVLTPEGMRVMVLNAIIGPKIAKLRLEGYSDDEILKMLENEEA